MASKQESSAGGSQSKCDKALKRLDKMQTQTAILGLHGSGKSVILDHLKLICKTYTKLERLMFEPKIIDAILDDFLQILQKMKESNMPFYDQETQETSNLYQARLLVGKGKMCLREMTRTMKILWKDENLQKFYNENIVDKSSQHFFNSLDRISSKKYKPTHNDIYHYLYKDILSVKSSESVEEIEVVAKKDNRKFIAINEESIWEPNCITAILKSDIIAFCVSLDDYDRFASDGKTNKIDEAKNLLIKILSIKGLENKPILMLFTKKDLFQEKLNRNEFGEHFLGVSGGKNDKDASNFWRDRLFNDPKIKSLVGNRFCVIGAICVHNRDEISKYFLSKEILRQAALENFMGFF